MRLSAIASYLSQSEAAIVAVLAEKIMAEAEAHAKRAEENQKDGDSLKAVHEDIAMAQEAQEAAYALKCVAEQSILANDGELFAWLKKVKESEVVKQGWIDTAENCGVDFSEKEGK